MTSTLDGERRIEYFSSVGSTSEIIRQRIAGGWLADQGAFAVVAAEQTHGRGRRGRTWLTTDGALLMSVAVPLFSIADAPPVSVCAALAALKTIRSVCPETAIKWPNDIVSVRGGEYKKLCGILTELVSDRRGGYFAIIGAGVNVNCESIPEGLLQPATSILIETGRKSDVKALCCLFYDALLGECARLRAGRDRLLDEFASGCVTIGREVTAFELSGAVAACGRAVGLDENGALLIETGSGIRAVLAADVSIRMNA